MVPASLGSRASHLLRLGLMRVCHGPQQVWDGVESQQAAVLRLRKQGGSPSRTIAVSAEKLL